MQRGLEPILDLGTIKEPLLIFGGPYSNLQATQAILKLADDRGFKPQQIICTGDVVAYCANPLECVELIQDAGIHVVMGNCEESLGFQLENCGCGFEEDSACDLASRQWFNYARSRLNSQALSWMQGLPRQIITTINNHRVGFIHGSVQSISGWVFASTPESEKTRHLDALGCDAVIGGHCGLPFASKLSDGRLWANAGVIGMPANDGTSRGWFATLEPKNSQISLKTEAFHYNFSQSSHAMTTAGLNEGYAKALKTGLWPNMDVLPEAERAICGKEIYSENILW
ncbi:MAG: metallophosphoesterase [Rhodospirillales bacterium]|jgi:predicted phosphodiesterase|nr:metallophosphoesterase [Rhodospirillales bacterium]